MNRISVLAMITALGLLAGCSLGSSTAFVGHWQAHDRVVVDACRIDDAGQCVERKQVVAHEPARAFRGGILMLPALGAASVDDGGERTSHLRAEAGLELLKGRGGTAVGVRAGLVTDVHAASAVPVMVVVRRSLTERLTGYAGAGFSPYAVHADETSLLGVRGLVGLDIALSRTYNGTPLVLSVEADTMWIHFERAYLSNGLSFHLGLRI